MNFIDTFDELNKLYEEKSDEKLQKIEEACNKEKLAEEAEDEEIEIVNDEETEVVDDEEVAEEAPVEEPAAEEESKQIIIECSRCGALAIVDEVVMDEESGFVNINDECKFCEEKDGYKIVGFVAPYEVAEEEPEEEPVDEAEATSDDAEESEELDELFNANVGVDLRNFGGDANKVSVLGLGEELEEKDEQEDDEDLDELFNANIKLDARGFGGTGNDVDVL
jgi:hypothetical protein